MRTEFEVKLLDIDADAFRKRLAALGARHVADREMRRYVYDLPSRPAEGGAAPRETWLRLRDDGERAQLTLKEIHDDTITGTKELEVDVGSFDEAAVILAKLGFAGSYQENRRESYLLDGVAIEIDTWPGIPQYAEVEGPDEASVLAMVERLGFSREDATSIGVVKVYARYGRDILSEKELRF